MFSKPLIISAMGGTLGLDEVKTAASATLAKDEYLAR
jgi:hypothetical protein